jgi:hypothetical protein
VSHRDISPQHDGGIIDAALVRGVDGETQGERPNLSRQRDKKVEETFGKFNKKIYI